MHTKDDISVEICRRLLRRAAWRIQYRTRMHQEKECYTLYDNQAYNFSFEAEVLSKIYVRNLLDTIPCEKCRYIIQRTIIDGLTEKDVAYELKITQQGVSKWKIKGLKLMQQTLKNSDKQ